MVCMASLIEQNGSKTISILKEVYRVAYLKAATEGYVKVKTVLTLWFQVHLLFVDVLWFPWEEYFNAMELSSQFSFSQLSTETGLVISTFNR